MALKGAVRLNKLSVVKSDLFSGANYIAFGIIFNVYVFKTGR